MTAHGMWDGLDGGLGIGWIEWLWTLVPLTLIIAFWALVVMLVAKLVKRRPSPSASVASSALILLEERYARGEITRDEFLERKAVLSGQATTAPL